MRLRLRIMFLGLAIFSVNTITLAETNVLPGCQNDQRRLNQYPIQISPRRVLLIP